MRSRTRAASAGAFVDDDAGAHRDVAAGQPGRVAPARGGQVRGRRPVRGRAGRSAPGDGLDEGRGDDERQVADPRHGPVMGRRAEPDRSRAARPGQPLDALDGGRRPAVGTTTHGRSTNRSAAGRLVAARLPPGHRVAAHEAQPERRRAQDDGLLRARDVGHDRVRGQDAPPRAGQLVELRQAVRCRAGQDDEVRTLDRLLRRRGHPVDDPVREGRRGSAPGRRPGGDRRTAAAPAGVRSRAAHGPRSRRSVPVRAARSACPRVSQPVPRRAVRRCYHRARSARTWFAASSTSSARRPA